MIKAAGVDVPLLTGQASLMITRGILCFVFQRQSHCVVQASLELRSSCLRLLGAGIAGLQTCTTTPCSRKELLHTVIGDS